MGRPTVPHCKECTHIQEFNCHVFWAYGFLHSSRSSWKCNLCDRWVTGQEVRTSPKWCPRRQNAES